MKQALLILLCVSLVACASRRGALRYPVHHFAPPPETQPQPPQPLPTYFTFGSSREEVAAVMGTPDNVSDYSFSNMQVWRYGSSSITFRNGGVTEWSNYGRNLKVRAPGAPDIPPSTSPASSTIPPSSSTGSATAPRAYGTTTRSYYTPSRSYSGSGNSSYGYVSPHVRRDGTFVEGHYRTTKDSSFNNNWSSSGNVNPFTGKKGYRTRY